MKAWPAPRGDRSDTNRARQMIDIDVRYLRSFLLVAEELNVTRAAARLHLTQQAVSTHVQQLERSLRVVLLVRTPRGVLPTAAGEELAAGGRRLVDDLAGLVERVRAVAETAGGDRPAGSLPVRHQPVRLELADAVEVPSHGLAAPRSGPSHRFSGPRHYR